MTLMRKETKNKMSETNTITLPSWLDDFIFNELGAKYCRQNANMTNIDDDKDRALNYLGTYFPRSYAEAYYIFCGFFQKYKADYNGKTELKIFDFGCGTGGEIIGMLTAIEENLPEVGTVEVVGFDGNQIALRKYEQILQVFRGKTRLQIIDKVFPHKVDDFYDFDLVGEVLNQRFDLVITFKAICEFVEKQQFETKNPYSHITKKFLPKLTEDGVMVLVDITVYSDVSEQWLPKMMDKGLADSNCEIIERNQSFNQAILVSHSRRMNDISKIAWRIIKGR